ncbi:MAG: hypothetical protein ACWGSQ_01980, partial [Longimicrobiales bacterium]
PPGRRSPACEDAGPRSREDRWAQGCAPDTNIVMLDIEAPGVTAEVILAFLAERGVLMVPFGPKRIRAVTHMDVNDEGIREALAALALAMRALARA